MLSSARSSVLPLRGNARRGVIAPLPTLTQTTTETSSANGLSADVLIVGAGFSGLVPYLHQRRTLWILRTVDLHVPRAPIMQVNVGEKFDFTRSRKPLFVRNRFLSALVAQ
jgi:hypothetical protein